MYRSKSICQWGDADEAVEPAVETAVFMVEQYIPQVTGILAAACGPVLDLSQLNEKLDGLAASLGLAPTA